MMSASKRGRAPHGPGNAEHPQHSAEGSGGVEAIQWEGPFPSPEDMAAYAKVSPELPGKILQVAMEEYQFQQGWQIRKERAANHYVITMVISLVALMAFSALVASALVKQGAGLGATMVVALPALSALIFFILTPLASGRAVKRALMQRRRAEYRPNPAGERRLTIAERRLRETSVPEFHHSRSGSGERPGDEHRGRPGE